MLAVSDMTDREVIARTLWAEARSQGFEGMLAVADVIRNRANNPGWWGHSPRTVCLCPKQFSCWNEDDPQYDRIRAETIGGSAYRKAVLIASQFDKMVDITNGADHYCTEAVAERTAWTKGHEPVAKVGTHLFYKLGLSG